MRRPLLLDLFCGAGGAAMGYFQAGYDVVGVDCVFQKRYPFPSVQADALEFLRRARLESVDVIHASPPCQAYTSLRPVCGGKDYPDLLPVTREALWRTGKVWVIENVMGAPIQHGVKLCGTMFPGLRVYRHRWFETSVLLWQPAHPRHRVATCRAGRQRKARYLAGGFAGVYGNIGSYCGDAMGIDWMTGKELSQAIPPAYTRWIGECLREHLMAGGEGGPR